MCSDQQHHKLLSDLDWARNIIRVKYGANQKGVAATNQTNSPPPLTPAEGFLALQR